MLLKSIKLTNFLSYGSESEPLALGPLNVLIGANGSGKSNLIEALEILRAAPTDLTAAILGGGEVRNWLWQGSSTCEGCGCIKHSRRRPNHHQQPNCNY